MVANLTGGEKGLEASWDPMHEVAPRGRELKDWFLAAVEEDTAAFHCVLGALRMPGTTPEEAAAKERTVPEPTEGTAAVPLAVLE
jgi:formiminotetrahydrofolate cyclodeaminase